MNLQALKEKARPLGVQKASKMRKDDLVHAIQAAEGCEQCYNTGKADVCGQNNCCFRDDCK
jgi:hypothetical protein